MVTIIPLLYVRFGNTPAELSYQPICCFCPPPLSSSHMSGVAPSLRNLWVELSHFPPTVHHGGGWLGLGQWAHLRPKELRRPTHLTIEVFNRIRRVSGFTERVPKHRRRALAWCLPSMLSVVKLIQLAVPLQALPSDRETFKEQFYNA